MIKTLHVLSGTVLFGTGLGIAFFFWSARRDDDASRLFAARTTVRADLLFTLPAALLQPITGAWLILKAGFNPLEFCLVLTYALYAIASVLASSGVAADSHEEDARSEARWRRLRQCGL